ncbi:MAG: hypothetical protein GOU97_00765 [Nanoarchaeota archaeon]|nr:hypothetical protein [Nanoarchaeota archaeon]
MGVNRWTQKIRGVFRSFDEITGRDANLVIQKLASIGGKARNYKIYFDPNDVGRKEIRVQRVEGNKFFYIEYYPVEWKESKPKKKDLNTKIYLRAGDFSILKSMEEQKVKKKSLAGKQEFESIETKLMKKATQAHQELNTNKLREISQKLNLILQLLQKIQ